MPSAATIRDELHEFLYQALADDQGVMRRRNHFAVSLRKDAADDFFVAVLDGASIRKQLQPAQRWADYSCFAAGDPPVTFLGFLVRTDARQANRLELQRR